MRAVHAVPSAPRNVGDTVTAHTPDRIPAADLVAALGALANINKTGDVQAGQRSYRYVELDELLDAARPILAGHNLALTQDVATDDTGALAVTTILWHTSGETFRFGPLRSHQPDAPQALGSLISYWRRYSAMAALGVAGADDDAQTAQNAPRTPRRSPQQDREQYGQTRQVQRTQASAQQPDEVDRQYQAQPQDHEHSDGPTGDLPATQKQQAALHAKLNSMGIPRDRQKAYLLNLLTEKRGVEHDMDYHLSRRDASLLFDELDLIRMGKPAGGDEQ